MQNRTILIVILLLLQINVNVFASGTETDSVSYRFNPVIVTATKIAGPQRDIAASISMIDFTVVQAAPSEAIFEVVNARVPGLYVTEWGVMGFGVAGSSAGKISMRGLGGTADTHVLILRNGRPDFMGLMGCTIADEFATDGIERIEVIRGPASFLYGTNATGGVINIVSKEIEKVGYETSLSGGIGSYASQKFALHHGGRLGGFNYTITAAKRTTDGHRENANSAYDS